MKHLFTWLVGLLMMAGGLAIISDRLGPWIAVAVFLIVLGNDFEQIGRTGR